MDTKLLNCFKLVVEHRNFTRAARILGLTQSAVSYQIASLERELGITLFKRQPHRVELTPQGRHVFWRVEEVLNLYRKIVDEARGLESGVLGQINLGIVGPVGRGFIPQVLQIFHDRHPGVMLHLSHMDLVSLDHALSQRTVDIGITLGFGGEERPGLVKLSIGSEPLAVVVPEGHFLGGRAVLSLDDLKGLPIVHFLRESDPICRSEVVRLFERRGLVPNLVQRVPDFDSLFLMVEAGVGIALMPEFRAATSGRARVKTVPLDPESVAVDAEIVWDPDSRNPALPILVAEAQVILNQAKSLKEGREGGSPFHRLSVWVAEGASA